MIDHERISYIEDQEKHRFDLYKATHLDQDEIDKLTNFFQIPRDFITSGQDIYETARFERHISTSSEEYILVVFNYPYFDTSEDFDNEYRAASVSIVIKPGAVLITSYDSLKALNEMTDVIKLGSFNDKDEIGVVLSILWFIARLYIQMLKDINHDIQLLEKQVSKATENDIFYEMMRINKALVYFNTAINNNQKVLNILIEHFDQLPVEVEKSDYSLLRDVQVEINQANNMVDQLTNLTTTIEGTLTNLVNNNLNQIMKILTFVSIILTVPTIISGMWGMNVPVPGQSKPLALPIISLVSIIIMYILYLFFKRNKWM